MALRTTPPDNSSGQIPARGLPVAFNGPGNVPPGEDGLARGGELENAAFDKSAYPDGVSRADPTADFLEIVRTAEQQSQLYTAQANRRAWTQSLRASHNEHYIGSKYTRPEWRGRSRLFVPKTRTALRKDMAAVAASLFNNIDAINCLPGDEGNPRQRGAAAVMEELVNYRADRTSGKASFPWFLVALGARMDADQTGICVSKQCWKQEFRKVGEEPVPEGEGEEGAAPGQTREHFKLDTDRPDVVLFPPENVIIHPGADWTNPAQESAYLILKYPMTVEEIQDKQHAPVNPWNPDITENELRTAVNAGKQDMEAIRRAREMGLDRYDESQTGTEFQVVWVYECFMRWNGDDWCFYSIGDQHYLTDPKPTRDVYPEQDGERPVTWGYGSLESHRIFPMSAVESWQPLQVETNDLRNLMLDATKQNVMPISKVKRGRRVDMDQIKRRSSGSSIFVDDPADVTWETPPQMGQMPVLMGRELDMEFDDLSGTQNYGSIQNDNAVGKTVGGLKLAAGAANAVQEFDVRLWIETWAQPTLAQIVRAEQYYESDPIVLGICGQRAQLFQKHGISVIDDKLLEEQVTIRVSAGLGAGDPQQRLAKFESAAQIVAPLAGQSPEFQSGQYEINIMEVWNEVFGAVGYKDGGERFLKQNPGPRPNPMMDLKTQELQATIAQKDRMGKGALLTGMANVAKVALGKRDLEANTVDMLLGHQETAQQTGFQHGHQRNTTELAAREHGHRHGIAIAEHRRNLTNDAFNQQQQQTEQAGEGAEQEGTAVSPSPRAAPSPAANNAPDSASSPPTAQEVQFVRHPQTNRIIGARMVPQAQQPAPQPQAPKPEPAPQPNPHEERMARMESALAALHEHITKPRKRKIIRDKDGRVTGAEDE